jgi:hypothetical protein
VLVSTLRHSVKEKSDKSNCAGTKKIPGSGGDIYESAAEKVDFISSGNKLADLFGNPTK